jgi:hypothetical protein
MFWGPFLLISVGPILARLCHCELLPGVQFWGNKAAYVLEITSRANAGGQSN